MTCSLVIDYCPRFKTKTSTSSIISNTKVPLQEPLKQRLNQLVAATAHLTFFQLTTIISIINNNERFNQQVVKLK